MEGVELLTDSYGLGVRNVSGNLINGVWCRDGSTTSYKYSACYVDNGGGVGYGDTALKYLPIGFCI